MIKNGNYVALFVDPMDEGSIQPHGYDLHIGSIHEQFKENHHSISESDRPQRAAKKVIMSALDYYELKHGRTYIVKFRESIHVPENCLGITTQRSSLMRNGVISNIGIWDAGYKGIGYCVLLCHTNLNIHKDMGVVQLIFMEAEDPQVLYEGIYQNEGIT